MQQELSEHEPHLSSAAVLRRFCQRLVPLAVRFQLTVLHSRSRRQRVDSHVNMLSWRDSAGLMSRTAAHLDTRLLKGGQHSAFTLLRSSKQAAPAMTVSRFLR